jgi:hypothetical protein
LSQITTENNIDDPEFCPLCGNRGIAELIDSEDEEEDI